MKKVIPQKLKPGDHITVIAPSCSGATIYQDYKKRAEKVCLNNLKLTFEYSKNVFEIDVIDSSLIKSRIHDLHTAFKDTKINGIFCFRGGYSANTLLPYIDWNLIKKNPKPLIGFSDITVLSNAIYAKTGLVSYSGPNFSSLGMKSSKILPYVLENFKNCVMIEKAFVVNPSLYFYEEKTKEQKNKGPIVIQNGISEGVIIGGNLCSINLLQGTEYMPNLKNAILFVEEDDYGGKHTPEEFDRNLESLLQIKNANQIRGLLIGRFQKNSNMNIKKLQYILSTKKLSKNIPIVADLDFGHTKPMFTFPIGGTIRVEAKNNKIKLEILKH